jgi:hypothetical protein
MLSSLHCDGTGGCQEVAGVAIVVNDRNRGMERTANRSSLDD